MTKAQAYDRARALLDEEHRIAAADARRMLEARGASADEIEDVLEWLAVSYTEIETKLPAVFEQLAGRGETVH